MFKKSAASVSLWIVLGLVTISAVPASAHQLQSASATANCQGYNLSVVAVALTVGRTYTVDYNFTITCNGGTPVNVPGSFNFVATAGTMTVTTSGTFSGLSGSCVVTGTAFLVAATNKIRTIIINGGTSATLTCTGYAFTSPPFCT